MERAGYYAALALLLAILGSASYAYRARRGAPQDRPDSVVPRAAIALRTPEPTATPQPTPEPMRWVLPLDGETLVGYSPEEPLWSRTLGQWQTHPALDIAGSPGEAVYACADGVVLDAWSDRLWGNVVVLEHEDGYRSTYAGLNTLKLAEVGGRVKAGDVIGSVGDSAVCEAELSWHLHFELERDGEPADIMALVS